MMKWEKVPIYNPGRSRPFKVDWRGVSPTRGRVRVTRGPVGSGTWYLLTDPWLSSGEVLGHYPSLEAAQRAAE